MPAFLSEAWLEAAGGAMDGWPTSDDLPHPVAPMTVTFAIKDGGTSWVRQYWSGAEGEPRELTLTLTSADARAVMEGSLSLSVAFMRGQLKTAGDPGAVVDFLEASATPAFTAAMGRLRAITDDPTGD